MSESRCLAHFSHISAISSRRMPNLAVALVAIILFGLIATFFSRPVYAVEPAQATAPQTIMLEPNGIAEWIVGGGFLYWCIEGSSPSQTLLQRMAVNGNVALTLDSPDSCDVLTYAAVDESGIYFYNPTAAAIQAIYAHGPSDDVQTLAASTSFMGQISLGEDHIYWMEEDNTCRSTDDVCVPLEARLQRVAKDGSTPQTLYTALYTVEPGLSNAGAIVGVAQGRVYWAEVNGLYTLVKPPCTPPPGPTFTGLYRKIASF